MNELKDYLTTLGLGAGAATTLTAIGMGAYTVVKWCAGAKREFDKKQEQDREKDERHEQQSLEWEKRFMAQANVMEEMQAAHIERLRAMIEEKDRLHQDALEKLEQRQKEAAAECERRCNERLDQLARDHLRDREEWQRGITTIQTALLSTASDDTMAQLDEMQHRNQPTKGINGNA